MSTSLPEDKGRARIQAEGTAHAKAEGEEGGQGAESQQRGWTRKAGSGGGGPGRVPDQTLALLWGVGKVAFLRKDHVLKSWSCGRPGLCELRAC